MHHQPPGACRHWQLRRVLADLFSTHMTAAAVLEAKVDHFGRKHVVNNEKTGLFWKLDDTTGAV